MAEHIEEKLHFGKLIAFMLGLTLVLFVLATTLS